MIFSKKLWVISFHRSPGCTNQCRVIQYLFFLFPESRIFECARANYYCITMRFGVFCKMRVFLLVWFGQLVSLIGSGMTVCIGSVGVPTYRFSYPILSDLLFALLPSILISPVAGALVDRWNRRNKCIILSDFGAGRTTVAMWNVKNVIFIKV